MSGLHSCSENFSNRYIDAPLAFYVKEDVLIRYNPADMAEIRVYYQDTFLCRAISPELSGQTVSLQEIEWDKPEKLSYLKTGSFVETAMTPHF